MFSIIYKPMHGIIYKNSKKEKMVMRHSEIYKFCDATLNRVLEGLKSYNNDVKYGYVQRELTNDEVEYLKLFEEEIEVRLKYRNLKIYENERNLKFIDAFDVKPIRGDSPKSLLQVMKAQVISISLDVSVESVGSSFPRVILIDSISVEVPVAPKVGAVAVASPAGVLEFDTHSLSETDPSESSPPPVYVAPMMEEQSCIMIIITYYFYSRDPTAPILPAPSAIVAPSSEFPLAPDIPIGRLFRTHHGGPCRELTARKSVRPLPSHHLALRYTTHHLDRFTSGSSSSHPSSDHSSSGHSISGHSISEHASPDTTVADSSTPPRFVHPPLARTPRCSEAYLHWRSAPLSTMYPLTTSESSVGDSSSESSAGPSRKRCRSPAATMTSSIQATRALVPSRVDLLPPHMRFRDSISPEDIDRDVVVGVDVGIDMEVDVGVDVEDEVGDEFKSSDRGTIEVGVDVTAGIDIPDVMLIPDAVERLEQRELESRILISGGERAGLLDQVASLKRSNARLRGTMMTERARADRMQFRRLETFVARRLVEESLAAYEATRAANVLEESQNGSDGDNGNGGNRNGGNGNPNENDRGARPIARECTYQDFMKCQPLNFKGTKGVVRLIRWFEKMETVFHISNFPEKYQVKYATCTLLNNALTWWNSHKRTIRADAVFTMSWRELMKLMVEVYCPGNEIQKMESEL
ncbi:hypothetical protein Tco_0954895 [Tanacetum coccineum]|uniref:Reverse transcriptase domain-containing protein n=1 Tax=Tanacetum coccineum TaxID=301880 RepID=A0ABQ5E5Q5_9ASTR